MDNPDEFAYNYASYYRHVYAPKSDLRLVLLGFLLVISAVQYSSQKLRYNQAMQYFRESDTVKRKAKQILHDRERESKRLKKKKRSAKKQELEAIIDELMQNVHISGGYAEPRIDRLIITRLMLLPYTLLKYLHWQCMWFYRHSVLKLPYDDQEREYLTCKVLKMPVEQFRSDEYDPIRQGMLDAQVWTLQRHELEELELYKRLQRMASHQPDQGDDSEYEVDSDEF